MTQKCTEMSYHLHRELHCSCPFPNRRQGMVANKTALATVDITDVDITDEALVHMHGQFFKIVC